MKSQLGVQTTKQQPPASPIFVEAEKLFEQMKEFSQSVARRAYEYFEARGREFGHDLEDWFRAESELMRRVPVEVKEVDGQITVRAEVPGFAANEIKISVEPQRLVISGKSEKTTEKKEQTLLSEFRSNQFCRELRLPAEVEPDKTTAVLRDGVLQLVFAKAAESTPPLCRRPHSTIRHSDRISSQCTVKTDLTTGSTLVTGMKYRSNNPSYSLPRDPRTPRG